MVLLFESRQVEIHGPEELYAVWQQIVQELQQKEQVLSRVELDGVEVYSDFLEVLAKGLEQSASQAVVHTVAEKEAVDDLMVSTFNYLHTLRVHLEEVANPFYGTLQSEDWQRLKQFVEGVDWVAQALHTLVEKGRQEGQWEAKLQGVVRLFSEEMEAGNLVGVGDILLYEFGPLLEDLTTEMEPYVGGEADV